MGLIDLTVIFLLFYDFSYFFSMPSTFLNDVGYFLILAMAVLYVIMRFYIYLMMVTFELSIFKLLKNALIFVILGIKRNVMAILGVALITAINVLLLAIFMPMGIAIPLILPFLYYLAVTAFTTAYAAYPVIDRYMIEPYRTSEDDEEYLDSDAEDASV